MFAFFIGLSSILFGYLRLVWLNTDDVNNVSLTRWAFTGGLPQFITGMISGIANIFAKHPDSNSFAALIVMFGVFVMWVAW